MHTSEKKIEKGLLADFPKPSIPSFQHNFFLKDNTPRETPEVLGAALRV
jgi:hypothetical protein